MKKKAVIDQKGKIFLTKSYLCCYYGTCYDDIVLTVFFSCTMFAKDCRTASCSWNY